MVVRRHKKLVKKRGSRHHGRGCSKRGRGSGERGGTGMSGGHKQKWSYILRYMPDYFGKHGFARPQSLQKAILCINVGEIDESLDDLVRIGVAQQDGEKYKVDLSKLGVSKVLGKGQVNHALEVSAEEFSETAKQKLEGAGGKAISGEGDGESGKAEV